MLKISISGLPGSGVTAILSETRKILGLKYRVEILDSIRGKNPFDNASRSGFISCFFDLTAQINEENTRGMTNPTLLLTNRSILDYWNLWMHELPHKTHSEQLQEKDEMLRHLVNFWTRSYDHFYFVHRDFKQIQESLESTSSSELSEESLRDMETGYLEIASSLGIQVTEIWNNGSIDEVSQNLIASISELLTAD